MKKQVDGPLNRQSNRNGMAGLIDRRCMAATLLVAPLLIAGCASTEAPRPQGPLTAIPAKQQFNYEHDLQEQINSLFPDTETGPVHALARADGAPSIRISGIAFQGESSELQPSALAPLADFAQLVQKSGPYIVHVLGEEPEAGSLQVVTDLAARKAAAVAAVLASDGLSADHIKAGTREQPGSAGGVIILLSPIVAGHEADALTPPPVEA
jgi:outer membrane protein OmpA-like peptidoglycan-associated protein